MADTLLTFLGGAASAFNKEAEAKRQHQRRIQEAQTNMQNKFKLAIAESEAQRQITKHNKIEDLHKAVEAVGGPDTLDGQIQIHKYWGTYDTAALKVSKGITPATVSMPEKIDRPNYGNWTIDQVTNDIKIDPNDPAKSLAIRNAKRSQQAMQLQGQPRSEQPVQVRESGEKDIRTQWMKLLRPEVEPSTLEGKALKELQQIEVELQSEDLSKKERDKLTTRKNVIINKNLSKETQTVIKDAQGGEQLIRTVTDLRSGDVSTEAIVKTKPPRSVEVDRDDMQRLANLLASRQPEEVQVVRGELNRNEKELMLQSAATISQQIQNASDGDITQAQADSMAVRGISDYLLNQDKDGIVDDNFTNLPFAHENIVEQSMATMRKQQLLEALKK